MLCRGGRRRNGLVRYRRAPDRFGQRRNGGVAAAPWMVRARAGRVPMTVTLAAAAPLLGGALGIGAIGVWLSGRREFLLKWLSFLAATPVLLVTTALGRTGVAVLAIAVAAACTREYARMVRLDVWMAASLLGGVGLLIGFTTAGHDLAPAAVLAVSAAVPLVA